jgi:alpha-L-fucosidase
MGALLALALGTAIPNASATPPVQAAPKPPKASDFSTASPKGTRIFEADWKNIAENYQIPKWFRDAKFGIFIHWGVYSVPAHNNEWYTRFMYQTNTADYRWHRQKFGKQDKFGYKDFIPLFKGEQFSPSDWVALFKEAGAKYVVPVAEHHDGFAMYDSTHNPWNSVKMGPKKDVIGLLKAETEKAGLVFGLSSHRLENSFFFNGGMSFPSDVRDTNISLYGFRLPGTPENVRYTPEVHDDFLAHTKELIDRYQPSLIWFDWTVNQITPTFNKFLAYYYNNAHDWGKGVVVNTKKGYPNNVQVSDVERGAVGTMMKHPWQTDTSVGRKSWGYVVGERNKPAGLIIQMLVDIVSKNGNLLLNIGPDSHGRITPGQEAVLRQIGAWLRPNGEAIYNTRPWFKFGEGPTRPPTGAFSDNRPVAYKPGDIRFTTNGDKLYAIALAKAGQITIRTLTPEIIGKSRLLSATFLGTGKDVEWKLSPEGLTLTLPDDTPEAFAYAFRLHFDTLPGAGQEMQWVDTPFVHGSPN